MNNSYSLEISDEYDEYPEVTQDDLNRAVFRVGLKSVSTTGKNMDQFSSQNSRTLLKNYKGSLSQAIIEERRIAF
jgi:hypothetical protein